MPRRTPVKELQKEEPVVSSPLRRSSRLTASSPVPTKVTSRRNSASEVATAAAPVTRSRRSSLSQESQPAEKPSTIRTRRSSASHDSVQEETVQKPRTRGSSVPKEAAPEVKRTTTRRKSITEDSEVNADSAKKITRSRSGSLTKKDDNPKPLSKKQTSSVKEAAASTPVKKKASPKSANGSLESIDETNTEPAVEGDENVDVSDDTDVTKGKKKLEVGKIDFDLSVINEASFVEDEASPQKKNLSKHEANQSKNDENVSELENQLKEKVSNTEENKIENPKPVIPDTESTTSLQDERFVSNDSKKNEELDSSMTDSSFNLQLSSSVLENSNKNEIDSSDKENICPEASVLQNGCEPMDVDESVLEFGTPVKNTALKSPKNNVEKIEIERELQIAEKVTDEIECFLSEEIRYTSEQEKTKMIQDAKPETEISIEKDLSVKSIVENEKSELSDTVETKQDESAKSLKNDADDSEISTTEQKHEKSVDFGKTGMTPKSDVVNPEDSLNDGGKETIEFAVEKQGSVSETAEESISAETVSNEKQSETASEVDISVPTKDKDAAVEQVNGGELIIGREDSEDGLIEIGRNILDASQNKPVESTSKLVTENSSDTKVSSEKIKISPNVSLADTATLITSNEENEIASCQDSSFKEQISNANLHESPENAKKATDASRGSDKTDECVLVTHENEKVIVPETEADSDALNVEKDTMDLLPQETENVINENIDDVNRENNKNNDSKAETVEQNELVDLCDSESEQEVNYGSSEGDDSYRSPVKKPGNRIRCISDDDSFTRKDVKTKKTDIFERSLDSKFNVSVSKKTPDKEKRQSQFTSEDLDSKYNVSLSKKMPAKARQSLDRSSMVFKETVQPGEDLEKSLSGRIHNVVDLFCAGIKNKSDVSVNVSFECTGQGSDVEDEGDAAKVIEISLVASGVDATEVSNVKGSKRRKICHASDNNSTSPVVDDLKNQSIDIDFAVTPSQVSETIEDEGKVASAKKRKKRASNIMSDFISEVHQSTPKPTETDDNQEKITSAKKGKKRDSNDQSIGSIEHQSPRNNTANASVSAQGEKIVTSPNQEKSTSAKKGKKRNSNDQSIGSIENQPLHNNTAESSPNVSVSAQDEKKVTSPKKSKKRKSTEHDDGATELTDKDVSKKSLKASVMFDFDDKSPSKRKNRKSTDDGVVTSKESTEDDQKKSPLKKLPATPFRLSVNKKSDEENGETTESVDGEPSDESDASDFQDSKLYNDLLSTSFGQSDVNDTTWGPHSDIFDSSDSEMDDDSYAEEEEDEVLSQESLMIEEKRRKPSAYSSNDDVFEEAVTEKEKSPDKKTTTRKLFRLSRYDPSQALASSTDSEESTQKKSVKSKPKSKHSEEIEERPESKNNLSKHALFKKSKNVPNMVPETSEVQGDKKDKKSKNREHLEFHNLEEEPTKKRKTEKAGDSLPKKKMRKGSKGKQESLLQIKPSRGRKNLKPLSIKPSTATTDGWDVTTIS